MHVFVCMFKANETLMKLLCRVLGLHSQTSTQTAVAADYINTVMENYIMVIQRGSDKKKRRYQKKLHFDSGMI